VRINVKLNGVSKLPENARISAQPRCFHGSAGGGSTVESGSPGSTGGSTGAAGSTGTAGSSAGDGACTGDGGDAAGGVTTRIRPMIIR
jgi:hypothetical protein